MNLKHVEFAVTAAAECSFSRAAARCHVTKPALSNGVAILERELGGALFARTTRKVELSAFGQRVLPMMEALHRAHRELVAGASAFHDPVQQLLRVGLSPLADARRVTQAMQPYLRSQVGCEPFFKECLIEDLDARLRSGQLDLVIRPRLGRLPAAISAVPLYTEALYYVSSMSSDIAGDATEGIRLKDIAKDVFVLGPEGCGLSHLTRSLFKTAGVRLREYGGQALSYHVMQEWTDLGIGSTLLPASKIAAPFRSRARRVLTASRRPAVIRFDALWMRRGPYPRHVVRLHEQIRELAAAVTETATAPALGPAPAPASRSARARGGH